jgi:hypothetical protein
MELIAYLLSSMGLTILVIRPTGGLGFTALSLRVMIPLRIPFEAVLWSRVQKH